MRQRRKSDMELFGEKENCCGCTACISICPQNAIIMKPDKEGFLYPIIDTENCIDCGLCNKVCPIKAKKSLYCEEVEVRAAKNLNDEVREESSSGGVFSAVAKYVLLHGGVVYGCAYNEEIRAVHMRVDNDTQINKLRGSKYVQSELGQTFISVKEDLEKGKYVLFTGTPCQVAGLNTFLKKDYDRLITLDFICTGVPSPLLFEEHIKLLESIYKGKVVKYYNRSKEQGWGKHIERAEFEGGTFESTSRWSQAYKEIFYSHSSLRPSCYVCEYASMNRVSDITVGDFWGIEQCNPEYKDALGVSIVLFNSKKAKEIMRELETDLDMQKVNGDGYIQPRLKTPNERPEGRDWFWEFYFKKGYKATIKKYTSCNWFIYLKKTIKSLLVRR